MSEKLSKTNTRKKRKRFLKRNSNFLSIVILSIIAFIMLFPFLWALSIALKGPGLAYQNPPRFFEPPLMFSNFAIVFEEADFLRYALNSAFIAVMVIIGELVVNSFVGFGLAKYNFKGANVIFFFILATMMLPENVMQIARYVLWSKVGGLDTYLPIILPKWFGVAFNIFLMRQCFLSIPHELYEAAHIDGANPIKIYASIYMPLAKATLATMTVTVFMSTWNNMFEPLIYLTTKSKYTLSIGLLYLKGEFEYNLELLIAASLISMLPVVVVYFFAQKYFVSGLVSSGVKG